MKFALLGHGYWGKKLRPVLEQHAEVLIVDPKDKTAVTFKSVLEDQSVTHIFIATPEETHFKLAMECLVFGKHTFVEKPLCLFGHEAEELVKVSRESGVVLFVDYIFLYDQHVRKIKEHILSGTLGSPKEISIIRHSPGIKKPNITVLDDLAIHDMYLMRYLFGKHPEQVTVLNKTMRGNKIVQADVHYCYTSMKVKANYSWVAEDNQREIKIIFSQGELSWSREKGLIVRFAEGDNTCRTLSFDSTDTTSPLELCVYDFVQRTQNTESLTTEEYIEDIRLLEQIRIGIDTTSS